MKSAIYHAFSQKEAEEFDVQHAGAQRAEAFVRAFLTRSMPRMSRQALEDQLQRKAVVLEYFTRRKQKEKKKRSRGLSARQRRGLRLFDIRPEQQRYKLFLPLHELWKQYIRDLCNGLKPDTQPQMIQAKLLKADLHGAIISVTKSKCPSYVGVTGILLQETKHVFKIITEEDRLKGTRLCPRATWAVVARPRRQPFPCSCEGLIWPQVSIHSKYLLTPH
ncbi:POP4-like protein, ribonuclease P/MRP subunit [Rhinolophus ferrumequinum]|uniref:Ribonuclease P protein subunit p29 n=1 Tax=Rhinolophus ferrumequinum TaxID=59479 RepID=A0A7J7SK79_RHIFE|nr:POP4-like protein, ribonuclease P/MRP subunit [Rhinolophus ferrumequinum]